jgi:hypothetical protein
MRNARVVGFESVKANYFDSSIEFNVYTTKENGQYKK